MSDIKVLIKNRNRSNYTFANINLLGKCNVNCYFCLGEDIPELLTKHNQIDVHFSKWKNFDTFLTKCMENGVSKLYLTGQNADSLQYRYIDELNSHLEKNGFTMGLRTNGYLAVHKMDSIKKCHGTIGYSIHTINPETNYKILKRRSIPDWNYILNNSGNNVRVSIVLNRYNVKEMYNLLQYISQFDKVKYIQIRRIATDKRFEEFKEDIDLFEDFYKEFSTMYGYVADYYLAPEFKYCGKIVTFWRTIETSINSLNYFTDGTISDLYFIVEGYEKNYLNKEGNKNENIS